MNNLVFNSPSLQVTILFYYTKMGNMNRRAKGCRLGLKVISVHNRYSKSGYHYPPNESIAFGGISLLDSIIQALNSWGLIGIKL